MSLDLDRRQRAMLHEMGVRVWWPPAPVAEPPAQAQAMPDAAVKAPPSAMVSVAAGADSIRAKGLNDALSGAGGAQLSAPAPAPAPASPPPPVGVAAPLPDTSALDAHALAHAVAGCQACGLCSGRRSAVLPAGRLAQQAHWLVVGEPPDEHEERAGHAFADQSGALLDNMLAALGVSRHGVGAAGAYLTNVVKCRPAVARNPEPAELAQCERYLRREVALVQPKVILAMGRFAAQALLRETLPEVATLPLGKLRQQVYHYHGIALLVTYPVSYLLRTQTEKARAWVDLCLAKRVLDEGGP